MNPFSAYEWLSFLIPGGVILFAAFFGWTGWPYPEPGATALVGILAAAYAVGVANTAVAALVEPMVWLCRPGSKQNPCWGMFGPKGTYPKSEEEVILSEMRARYGTSRDFPTAYHLAYTELQQLGKDTQLQLMNERIGFHRNMATACLAATGIVIGYAVVGRDALPANAWVPLFLVGTVLFAYRYKRFWKRFGDNVIRGFRALPSRA